MWFLKIQAKTKNFIIESCTYMKMWLILCQLGWAMVSRDLNIYYGFFYAGVFLDEIDWSSCG